MRAWLASGAVLDWIMLGVVLETLALAWFYATRRQGIPPGALLPNLGAGFSLLLAMRLALGGAWWGFMPACLLAALIFHLIDLRRRWPVSR